MGGSTWRRRPPTVTSFAVVPTRPGAPRGGGGHGTMADDAISRALTRATALAARGPQRGGNPRVGCVILAPGGRAVAEGWHRGAGSAHAEAGPTPRADPAHPPGTTAAD